jgi:hypothetical protein
MGCGSKVRSARDLGGQDSHVRPGRACLRCQPEAYDLDAAVDAIAPAVTPTGFVLPLLNGIAHMEPLNRRSGETRVLGGTIRQLNDGRTITFGEQFGAMSDRVERLGAARQLGRGSAVSRDTQTARLGR